MSIIYIFIIFSIGFILPNILLPKEHRKVGYYLWGFHAIISVYYCLFVYGDAMVYWRNSKDLTWDNAINLLSESQGTYFIHGVNYFFAGLLRMNYLSNTLLFGMLGFWGILYFYRIANDLIPYNSKLMGRRLFPLLFFFPMLHFWSSGIGKDTLLFWSIGMFAFGMCKLDKRWHLIVFALLLAYLVRPHIALLLVVAFGITYLSESSIATWKRFFLSLLMLLGAIIILPKVMEYVNIQEVSIETINSYSNTKADLLSRSETGSSVDISSYPLPLKWFTFLFRPLFFDINGLPAVIASFENLLLLFLFFRTVTNKPVVTFKKAPFVIKGLTIFLLFGTLILSGSLGNLGIIIRMRNMFLPGMMIYFLWALSYKQQFNYLVLRKKFNLLKSNEKQETLDVSTP